MSFNSNPERLPLINSKHIIKPLTIRVTTRCVSGFFIGKTDSCTETGAKRTAKKQKQINCPLCAVMRTEKMNSLKIRLIILVRKSLFTIMIRQTKLV